MAAHLLLCSFTRLSGAPSTSSLLVSLPAQVTESITKVDVFDKTIWSSAEYVHNAYLEGKDKAFYLCPDRINAADVRAWARGVVGGRAWQGLVPLP